MSNLAVDKKLVRTLIEGRKMFADDIIKKYECRGEKVLFKSLDEVKDLSDKLVVPLQNFFDENDLDNGVKVGRKHEGFSRTVEKNGTKYYTYNHLATTKTEPNLMALRVDLLCRNVDKVVLNGGHNSKEIIYVTKGKVRMDWEGLDKNKRHVDLDIGDSAYLSPGVPHSFMALEDNSELIAINY